jgi:hypothetical protein
MRTILAILAALAIATAARAETEALVTDPSNNVISSRAGALVLSNDLSVRGAARLSDSGLGFDEAMIFNAEENSLFSVYGDTIATWGYETPQFQLAAPLTFNNPTNAAATRTNIGLGDTNTPTFAGLTLTTLTNATGPNLVVADTNGTLTTGSVPSGAAPLGAALQADGSGSSAFSFLPIASLAGGTVVQLTNSVSVSNTIATTNLPVSWTAEANATYLIATTAQTSHGGGGIALGILFPSAVGYANNASGAGVAVTGGGAYVPVWSATTNNLRIAVRGGVAVDQQIMSAVMVKIGTNGGTVTYNWGAAASNATASTILSMESLVIKL